MATGKGALGHAHGWIREDGVRAKPNAIQEELALAIPPGGPGRGSWPAAACCACA